MNDKNEREEEINGKRIGRGFVINKNDIKFFFCFHKPRRAIIRFFVFITRYIASHAFHFYDENPWNVIVK